MDYLVIGSILFAILAVFAVLGYAYYVKQKRERNFDEVMESANEALRDCARANTKLADQTGEVLAAMTNFIIAMMRVALEVKETDQAEGGPELEFSVAWDKLPSGVLSRIVEEFGEDVVDRMKAEGF